MCDNKSTENVNVNVTVDVEACIKAATPLLQPLLDPEKWNAQYSALLGASAPAVQRQLGSFLVAALAGAEQLIVLRVAQLEDRARRVEEEAVKQQAEQVVKQQAEQAARDAYERTKARRRRGF